MSFRIGLDVGGTKIEGVVLDGAGKELHRKRIPTLQENGYDFIVRRIADLYRELSRLAGDSSHTLGIGTPGSTSLKTGLHRNSNTTCLNGRPFLRDLSSGIGREFELQNDANCFALAEAVLGAGRGKRTVFGVILGTGCGGGIVIDGRALAGLQGIAGEWGHSVLDPAGPDCYCGHRGCVETWISGGGAERRYRAAYGRSRSLADIFEAYRRQEEPDRSFAEDYLDRFGRALANLIDVLDPDAVVLGGGVSNLPELYSLGVQRVERCVFSDSLATPILSHQLGDSAGVIGAALIGR